MTIEFQCDGCEKILRTADDKAGRTARCPQCGKELTVPEAEGSDFENSSPPPPPRSHLSDFEELAKAPPRRSRQPVPITCPMCGEVNENTTDRCLACGEPLDIPAAGGEVSTNFGDIWNRAWEVWTANLGINAAAAAICAGIWVGVNFLVNIAILSVMTMPAEDIGGPVSLAIVSIVLQVAKGFIPLILYSYLFVGFAQFAIENVRRENPRLESRHITGWRIVPILGTMLCYSLITFLFLIPAYALFIGGVIVAGQGANEGFFFLLQGVALIVGLLGWVLASALFWPVPFMLADRSSRYLQSLADAPRMGRRFFGLSTLLAISIAGLSLAGFVAFCVGLLFSVPLAFILQAVAYEHCRRSMRNETGTP